MKMIRVFAVSLFATVLFSVSALAQTAAQVKIAVIDTSAFADTKAGITKYINAVNAIDTEFKPLETELQGMMTKYQTLAKDIQALQTQATNNPKVPIDEKAYQAKVDEAQKLERDIKFKQEDAKARLDRRQQVVLGPVMQDIGKAIQEFAKQKGYALIFDLAKDNSGFLLAIGDEKIDVTKEFVTFYNARPATTATTATPK